MLAAYRVHPGSQSFASTSQIKADEPVQIIEAYFESPLVPEDLRPLKAQALSMAHLNTARLHLRMGSYRRGMSAMRRAFALNPRNMISWRAVRITFNGLFNRIGHRLLWTLRSIYRRK